MAEHRTAVASAVRPHQPARHVIASFDNYADTERAVDYLADHQFGRRDFATVSALQPRHFDIVADVEVADRAVQLLRDS
jgi:hypothetical protein